MSRRWPHRVTVSTRAAAENAIGEDIITVTANRTAWANVIPITGDEKYFAGREDSTATHRIEMMYDPSDVLTTNDQITFGTAAMDVIYVENVGERNRYVNVLVRHNG